jgi:hypothetical protein
MRSAEYGTSVSGYRSGGRGCGCHGASYQSSAWLDPMKWYSAMYAPLLESLQTPGEGRRYGWESRKPSHHHHDDCGCDCGPCWGCDDDPCHCRCCITDADLVVYTRVGERRVVPVVIENARRRERDVRLSLGDFRTRGGKPADVTGRIVGPTEFTLKPCEEHETFIVVELRGEPDRENRRELPDVDDCTVYYAELHVDGCGTRSTRIALAVLPRDCSPHRISCSCHCC